MTDVTLVGSCMPEANDVRVASAVTAKRLGWLTQPKMFFYSATFALITWFGGYLMRAISLGEKSFLSGLASLLLVATTPLA